MTFYLMTDTNTKTFAQDQILSIKSKTKFKTLTSCPRLRGRLSKLVNENFSFKILRENESKHEMTA